MCNKINTAIKYIAAFIAHETMKINAAIKETFRFILLQNLFYCSSGFMCNKIK